MQHHLELSKKEIQTIANISKFNKYFHGFLLLCVFAMIIGVTLIVLGLINQRNISIIQGIVSITFGFMLTLRLLNYKKFYNLLNKIVDLDSILNASPSDSEAKPDDLVGE